jgi:hypothetical protein
MLLMGSRNSAASPATDEVEKIHLPMLILKSAEKRY